MRKACLLALLAAILAGSVGMIAHREIMLAQGVEAFLPLAPRDPRALMTGDYMALDYRVNRDIAQALRKDAASRTHPRRAVLRLVAGETPGGEAIPNLLVFVRLDDGSPLEDGELFLAFRTREHLVISASPAFHFQEGRGGAYERARYGRLRLSPSGASLLEALCDAEGRDIRPE
ncbi:MAG: GDYXXLXY domain-containing protein [Desulfovibrio sp.]|jgi:uncharacterized membrane-anchored protein|nr:GDYXXLXY domain-containing protein [Desulfovibrio sp.]